jgi:fructokinase
VTVAPLVAGVELGGSKCVCILATGPEDVRVTERIATRAPRETLADIRAVLASWREAYAYQALGIASFGPLDLDTQSAGFGSIVGSPKPGWDRTLILPRERAGVPMGFDTDVNAAALAEARWGNARGLKSFAYVTVGTGVGVGAVVAQRLVRGLGHSEAGHTRVARLRDDSWPGACAFHQDCVEGLASGPAIAAATGVPVEALAATHEVWRRVAHALAGLAHNLVYTVCPERIIFGGGVVNGQPQLLPRVRAALVASLGGYAQAGVIAPQVDSFVAAAGLGPLVGPLGAVALALGALERSSPL